MKAGVICMDIFHIFEMIGGLSLFLFGMSIMGQALERKAGGKLGTFLQKLTIGKTTGFLTGLGVTALIQSSSAATVMVVGFVNSGLMTLKQAIHVIMGANVGTTITAWILSLAGIESSNFFVKLCKPSSFTPILAMIGIIFYLFTKNNKKKDTGLILLGFATLMFGMETMADAVSTLKDVPEFQELFLLFKNPILGVIAGAILTAIIQSSSASVGILQSLATTGQVSYGAAIPIIMGQNIGTCVTAILSSFGANKNAKRAAMVHLFFNVIGATVWLTIFVLVTSLYEPTFLNAPASLFGIALAHTIFNLLCTLLLLPMGGILERLANACIQEDETTDTMEDLDERFLNTPAIALERCRQVVQLLGQISVESMKESMDAILHDLKETSIREKEALSDRYEDMLGSYLVNLSSRRIDEKSSADALVLLKVIGDFERIADHSLNLLESKEELEEKSLSLTPQAISEFELIKAAVTEILDITYAAFINDDMELAEHVEPLEQVIDHLKDDFRTSHILRLQHGQCSIETGFIWSDILTDLERASDHCSNIAATMIETSFHQLRLHESLREYRKDNAVFMKRFHMYQKKYRSVIKSNM